MNNFTEVCFIISSNHLCKMGSSDHRLEDKVVELKSLLKTLEIGLFEFEEKSADGVEAQLQYVICAWDGCVKEPNDTEKVLNHIASILAVMPPSDSTNKLMNSFIEKFHSTPLREFGSVCLRVLWVLINSLDKNNPYRPEINYRLISIANREDTIQAVFKDVEQFQEQFAVGLLGYDDRQTIFRLLYEALVAGQRGDIAVKVMMALLSSVTEENVKQAEEDAKRCIITAISDPKTFSLDTLLYLKPVEALKGELIHDLLQIFVSSKLHDYSEFYKKHAEFVNNSGLNHDQNIRKMRLLTFKKLTENSHELSFETLTNELLLPKQNVENFIIEAIKSKVVCATKVTLMGMIHHTVDVSLVEDEAAVYQGNGTMDLKTKYFHLATLSDISCRILKIAEMGENFAKKKKKMKLIHESTRRKHKIFLFLVNANKLGEKYFSFCRSLERATRTTDMNALAIQISIVYEDIQMIMYNLKVLNVIPEPLFNESAYVKLTECIQSFDFE